MFLADDYFRKEVVTEKKINAMTEEEFRALVGKVAALCIRLQTRTRNRSSHPR